MDSNIIGQRSRKSQIWQCTPVFSAPRKWRQKGQEFKVVTSYIMTSRLAWGTWEWEENKQQCWEHVLALTCAYLVVTEDLWFKQLEISGSKGHIFCTIPNSSLKWHCFKECRVGVCNLPVWEEIKCWKRNKFSRWEQSYYKVRSCWHSVNLPSIPEATGPWGGHMCVIFPFFADFSTSGHTVHALHISYPEVFLG